MKKIMRNVIAITAKAGQGVDYSPRFGALCPYCGDRAKVTTTRPWEGSVRVRYHRCMNKDTCVVAGMDINIKSIEEDRHKQ